MTTSMAVPLSIGTAFLISAKSGATSPRTKTSRTLVHTVLRFAFTQGVVSIMRKQAMFECVSVFGSDLAQRNV